MTDLIKKIELPDNSTPSQLAGGVQFKRLATPSVASEMEKHEVLLYGTSLPTDKKLSEQDGGNFSTAVISFLGTETSLSPVAEIDSTEPFEKYSFNKEDYEGLRKRLDAIAQYLTSSDATGTDPSGILIDINNFIENFNKVLSTLDDIANDREAEVKKMFRLNQRPDGLNYLVKRMGKGDLGSPKYPTILKEGIDYLLKIYSIPDVSYMSTTQDQHIADAENRNNWIELID